MPMIELWSVWEPITVRFASTTNPIIVFCHPGLPYTTTIRILIRPATILVQQPVLLLLHEHRLSSFSTGISLSAVSTHPVRTPISYRCGIWNVNDVWWPWKPARQAVSIVWCPIRMVTVLQVWSMELCAVSIRVRTKARLSSYHPTLHRIATLRLLRWNVIRLPICYLSVVWVN